MLFTKLTKATIYQRYYVAELDGTEDAISEFKLCRDTEGILRHWSEEGPAKDWVKNECLNSHDTTLAEFVIIKKEVSFSHDDFAAVIDIDDILR